MRLSYLLLPLSLVFLFACGKKDTSPAQTSATATEFSFTTLKADRLELEQGEVANIIAEVKGDVSYSWIASSGNIFGNGRQVLFGAGTCCSGEHTITCTVTDAAKRSDSKSIILQVRP